MKSAVLLLFPDQQNYGTNALQVFLDACLAEIPKDRGNAAIYALLAYHTEILLEAYHQTPLPANVSDAHYKLFRGLIDKALESFGGTESQRLDAANELASADFFPATKTELVR